MEQLMEWMQGAEEETNNGLDPLLALADQAETQATPAAMPSQQVSQHVIAVKSSQGELA